jgi:hypothetical protein
LAYVAVVQPTDFRKLHDSASRRKVDGPDVGCVLGEREMRASFVIVAEVAGQDAAQVSFPEHENMIQALASDGANEPLGEGICQGLCGAMTSSAMFIPLTRCWK